MARSIGLFERPKGSGQWYARVHFRGRMYCRKGADKTHARLLYSQMKAAIARGEFVTPKERRAIEHAPSQRVEGGPRLYCFAGKRPQATEGVYFLQHLSTGCIKVGYASNVLARIADLLVAVPGACLYLGAVKGDMALERSMHAELSEWRETGEWFRPDEALLEHLIQRGAAVLWEVRIARGRARLDRPLSPEALSRGLARLAQIRADKAGVPADEPEG